LPTIPVVKAGRVEVCTEHKAASVYGQVALPSGETLCTIVSTLWSSNPGALYRLTVDHRPARVTCTPLRLTHLFV
jgi:hypothetical protein